MLVRRLAYAAAGIRTAAAAQFSIANFQGQITDDTGLLRSLKPVEDLDFDYSPNDVFDDRNGNGNYHTGDITIQARTGNADWTAYSTATNRNVDLPEVNGDDSAIQSQDLSAVFDAAGLQVIRTWAGQDGDLVLTFNITNSGNSAVEIGSLEFPVEINNALTNRAPEAAIETCSFIDPYIGLDAGYAQVTRLDGLGPNMVVTPAINGTQFEAWRFLHETNSAPLYYQSTSYEGNYAWVVHSQAYLDGDWAGTEPWNEPTSRTLDAGESASYGLRFTVASSVSGIEGTLSDLGRPVAVGLPGYIIPRDTVGSLYLNSASDVSSIAVSPTGALAIEASTNEPAAPWVAYSVTPSSSAFGRTRVTITYADGTAQVISYWVADDGETAMSKIGQHAVDKQWFTDDSDPFNRAPSIISYNKAIDDFVLQDDRAWIAGLSDEGGAGSFVTFAVKQIIQPDADEVNKLEQFATETVHGVLQGSGNQPYAVNKSLFYYDPQDFPNYDYDPQWNWNYAWPKAEAQRIDRTYDYVWVSVLYWALYKTERASPGILTLQEPTWYLEQAYQTVNFGIGSTNGRPNTGYSSVGLMGESHWGDIIEDLRRENMTTEADKLEDLNRDRQAYWASIEDPFGSEQPWDCTGQEAVYYWSRWFNDSATAEKTINSIHGFDPTIPHWGYNGNARRYWDFLYAGAPETSRIERQIHHYGSALNAICLLDDYRRSASPASVDNFYNLRVGFGGHTGSLSNIDDDGFTSMAFHSYADTLTWDPYTGDYGPNFVGHYQTSASYLVEHPDFGWVSFGGSEASLGSGSGAITVEPRDALRRRAYVAPLGLFVVMEAGQIESYTWHQDTGTLNMEVVGTGSDAQSFIMWYEETSDQGGVQLTTDLKQERGGYVVDVPAGGSASLEWTAA